MSQLVGCLLVWVCKLHESAGWVPSCVGVPSCMGVPSCVGVQIA